MTWFLAVMRTRLGQGLALALAALAALGLYGRSKRSQGRSEAEQEAQDETQRRVEKGRKAVRDGRGDDPDERLRRNDGKWR